jgi:hypothetical protein
MPTHAVAKNGMNMKGINECNHHATFLKTVKNQEEYLNSKKVGRDQNGGVK